MAKAEKTRTPPSFRTDPLKPSSGNARKQARPRIEKPVEEVATTTQAPFKDCRAGNYLLYINLNGTYEPPIIRLLSVPPYVTMNKLDTAIRVAFGWAGSEWHQFVVQRMDTANPWNGDVILQFEEYARVHWPGEPGPLVEDETKYSLATILENYEYRGRRS